MVAMDVGAQLQVPPASELVKVMVLPWQNGIFPAIAPGNGVTVITVVTVPQVVTYDMVAVPVIRPVAIPVVLIVATDVGTQLHVPPANGLLNVIEVP
jgi:hypothetical protein